MKRMLASMVTLALGIVSTACGGRVESECDPPKPRVELIEPASAKQHTAGVLLTVRGEGFVPTSAVFFDGHALVTSYISPQQLRATIPLDYLHNLGAFPVDVFNPADVAACDSIYQSGSSRTSNALLFTIVP
jgi:hypothetical protein